MLENNPDCTRSVMKTERKLFWVLIIISLFAQTVAMDQCKQAAKIVGFGMGCGAIFGVANKAYTYLRFEYVDNEKETLCISYYNAIKYNAGLGVMIGVPAAAASLLGLGKNLKTEDVMMPIGVGMVGLFGCVSATKEYNYYKTYYQDAQSKLSGPTRRYLSAKLAVTNTQRPAFCATWLLALGLLPGYLIYQRYWNI